MFYHLFNQQVDYQILSLFLLGKLPLLQPVIIMIYSLESINQVVLWFGEQKLKVRVPITENRETNSNEYKMDASLFLLYCHVPVFHVSFLLLYFLGLVKHTPLSSWKSIRETPDVWKYLPSTSLIVCLLWNSKLEISCPQISEGIALLSSTFQLTTEKQDQSD